VADAFGIDRNFYPSSIDALEEAAMAAMLDFYMPLAASAVRMAAVVEEARGVRAAAVARAAEEVAARADMLAAALQAKGNAGRRCRQACTS
jgi:hypothetical protein